MNETQIEILCAQANALQASTESGNEKKDARQNPRQ